MKMELYRSKHTAAQCKFLTQTVICGERPECGHISFGCTEKIITGDCDYVSFVTFESLDICCVCKKFIKGDAEKSELDILKERTKQIQLLLPDWTPGNQMFDLRICPDCNTLQLIKPMVEGSRCDNAECESVVTIHARKDKHEGELKWSNENWG